MPSGNREVKAKSWTTTAILTLVEPLIRRLIRRALVGELGGDSIDHGILNGLIDDDHLQYLLDDAATGGNGIDVTARIISVILSEIDHDLLLNFLGDEHIDWTSTTEPFSTSGTAATGDLTVTGDIAVSGVVDGRDIAVDGAKLDAIDDDAMLTPIGLSMGNTTTVTGPNGSLTLFLYLGRAFRALTSATLIYRLTTAWLGGIGGAPWAEVGVFTGNVIANGSAVLSRVGFTDISTIFNTVGIHAVTVALSGVSIGDPLWLAYGSNIGLAGIEARFRGMLADDIQSGVIQQVVGRISTLPVPQATLLSSSTMVPAWARLKI